MTNSEKLLGSFSENYFYKELVYADLKFTPIGGTEIELADLIINLEDIILAIQLKERNKKDRTQDKNIEEKWLKKKCKKAKEQIKDTISYITSEKVSFINARGKKTIINPSAEVVPLVVFENNSISEYEHLLRNHTNDGFGQFTKKWDLATAALVLCMIPIVIFYLSCQKHIVKGITAGVGK